jgi:hypothetical protein
MLSRIVDHCVAVLFMAMMVAGASLGTLLLGH